MRKLVPSGVYFCRLEAEGFKGAYSIKMKKVQPIWNISTCNLSEHNQLSGSGIRRIPLLKIRTGWE
jgi:hypothetical protein